MSLYWNTFLLELIQNVINVNYTCFPRDRCKFELSRKSRNFSVFVVNPKPVMSMMAIAISFLEQIVWNDFLKKNCKKRFPIIFENQLYNSTTDFKMQTECTSPNGNISFFEIFSYFQNKTPIVTPTNFPIPETHFWHIPIVLSIRLLPNTIYSCIIFDFLIYILLWDSI